MSAGVQNEPVAVNARAAYQRFDFAAMGTSHTVTFAAPSVARGRAFESEVRAWVAAFESRYSVYRPDSWVSAVNRAAGVDAVPLTPADEELLAICDWLHWVTKGIVDPTIGPLTALWDFRRTPVSVPDSVAIEAARGRTGWARVQRGAEGIRLPVAGMRLDFGGLGKEYAADRVFRMAEEAGLTDVAVNFGQDVRAAGSPPEGGPWRIGLEHPERPGECWAGVALQRQALCCSGDYQRYFEIAGRRYSHIIDPRSGRPAAAGCRAVWVIAPTCVEAGGLARAASVLGADAGLQLIESVHQAAGCLWTEGGIIQTRRFGRYVLESSC